jgi:hypothetical protein
MVFTKFLFSGVKPEPEDVEIAIINAHRKIEGIDVDANKMVGDVDIDFTDHELHPLNKKNKDNEENS